MHQDTSRVVVVFKTHLDIGFTGDARSIVRQYLESDIPAALRLARATRDSPRRFIWTTGSWLVYRFLEDAGTKDRRLMEAAIEAGDFSWHALPFTTHTELMDASLFRLGLRFSRLLDSRFGRSTIAAKMTDVPGHTKGIVPLLAENGVRLLHIGVNPASSVPEVPPVFVWKVGDAEIVVIYEKVYGATTQLPGGMVASVNLTSDNCGPQNPEQIDKVFLSLAAQFPKAKVQSGSLNEIARWTWKHRKSLPVVTQEIGDTWIHGVGTDPWKITRYRELCRFRAECLASGALQEGGRADIAFSENLLLVAEHTWGMDIKAHLNDWTSYSRSRLGRSRKKASFRLVEASWQEQRDYLSAAVNALPTRLRKKVRPRLSQLNPVRPEVPGKIRDLQPGKPVQLGDWEVGIDPLDGSICHLRRTDCGTVIADKHHRLAGLSYQTFSAQDYDRFYRKYNTQKVWWAEQDFTKYGLPSTVLAGWHVPRLKHMWLRKRTLYAELSFSREACRLGAPAQSLLAISALENGLAVQLQWFKKPANRMPEALWLKFAPRMAACPGLTLEKLGLPIDPQDVVRKGNRHLHAVTGAVKFRGLDIRSLDAILVAPGKPQLLHFHQKKPNRKDGVSYNLYNNVWGTNFPMWYSDDALFRFELSPS